MLRKGRNKLHANTKTKWKKGHKLKTQKNKKKVHGNSKRNKEKWTYTVKTLRKTKKKVPAKIKTNEEKWV